MTDWRVLPGSTVSLKDLPTLSKKGAAGDKSVTESDLKELTKTISGYQERLWAEHKQSLLVVLQAMDTGGKDGTIRAVFLGVNPQGVHITSFKAPTAHELDHDFLWRIHQAAPAKGEIGVFNRSHYEDVLVVRVKNLVPEDVWRPRYELINDFEKQLSHGSTTIIKFFLHMSKAEQAQRLQARLDDPSKHWKFNAGDLAERERWDDYQAAYQEAIERTSTDIAPWYVIPSDRKWYRNWAVGRVIAETLERMNPQVPPAENFDPNLKIV
ncbi:MAG: polyphosphate kinase 2 family protein [Actinomycetota bacterium]